MEKEYLIKLEKEIKEVQEYIDNVENRVCKLIDFIWADISTNEKSHKFLSLSKEHQELLLEQKVYMIICIDTTLLYLNILEDRLHLLKTGI